MMLVFTICSVVQKRMNLMAVTDYTPPSISSINEVVCSSHVWATFCRIIIIVYG